MTFLNHEFGKIPISKVSVIALVFALSVGTVAVASMSDGVRFSMASVFDSVESDVTPIETEEVDEVDDLEEQIDSEDSAETESTEEAEDTVATEIEESTGSSSSAAGGSGSENTEDSSSNNGESDSENYEPEDTEEGTTSESTEQRDLMDVVSISTCSDLQNIANDLSADYILVNDINCLGFPFEPIGDADTPFTGTLDGNGHTILNLGINSSDQNVGLFGVISGDVFIVDVGINNSNVTSHSTLPESTTGILAGSWVDAGINGSVQSVVISTTSLLSRTSNIGMLIGKVEGPSANFGTIANISVNNGSLLINAESSLENVGGIVGSNTAYIFNVNINELSILKDSTEEVSHLGGVVGHNLGATIINAVVRNFFTTLIDYTFASNPTAVNSVGGIVGTNNMGTLINVAVMADLFGVSSVQANNNVGGVVGSNIGGYIERAHSSSPVFGTNNVGGVVGHNSSFALNFGIYSNGQVSGFENVGGLIGLNDSNSQVFSSFSAAVNIDGVSNTGLIIGSFDSNNSWHSEVFAVDIFGIPFIGDQIGDNTQFEEFIYADVSTLYSPAVRPYVDINTGQRSVYWGDGDWCFSDLSLPILLYAETCFDQAIPIEGDVEITPDFTSLQPTMSIAGQSNFSNFLVEFFTNVQSQVEQDLRDIDRNEEADQVAAMSLEEFYENFKREEQNPLFNIATELAFLGLSADIDLTILESASPVGLNVNGPTFLNIAKTNTSKGLETFVTRVPSDIIEMYKNLDFEGLEQLDGMFESPEQMFLFFAEEFKFVRALNLGQGINGYNLVIPELPGTGGHLVVATVDPAVAYNFIPSPEFLLSQLPIFDDRGGFGLLSNRNLFRDGPGQEPVERDFQLNATIQLYPIQNSNTSFNQTRNLNTSIQGVDTPSNIEFSIYQGSSINTNSLKFVDYFDELMLEMLTAFVQVPEAFEGLLTEAVFACLNLDSMDPEQRQLFEELCSQLDSILDFEQIIEAILEDQQVDDISEVDDLESIFIEYVLSYVNDSNITQMQQVFVTFALEFYDFDELEFELPFNVYKEAPGISLNSIVPGVNELRFTPNSEDNSDNIYVALAYNGSRSQMIQDLFDFTTKSGINLLPFAPIRIDEPEGDPAQLLSQFLSKFGLLGATPYISIDTGEPEQSFNLDFGQIVFNGLAPKGYVGSVFDLLTFTTSNYSEMTVVVLEIEDFLTGGAMDQYIGRGLDSIDLDNVVTLLSDPEFQLNLYTFPVSPLGSQSARGPISGSDPCKINPDLPQCPEDEISDSVRGTALLPTQFNPQAGITTSTQDQSESAVSRFEAGASESQDETARVARVSQDGLVITESDIQKLIRECGEQRLELLVLNNFESCNLELSADVDRLLRINMVEDTMYFRTHAIPVNGTVLVRNPEVAEQVNIFVRQGEINTLLATKDLYYLPSSFEGRQLANFTFVNDTYLPDGEYELVVMVRATDGRNFGHSKTVVIGELEDEEAEFPNAPQINSFGLQQASQVVPATLDGRLTVSENSYVKPVVDLNLDPGYIVNATWNSRVLLSASVADLITGKASLTPPNDFELNQNYTHTLTLYAYNPEDPSVVGQTVILDFPSAQYQPSKLPKAGGILALAALIALAGYYYYRNLKHTKSKKNTKSKKKRPKKK